MEDREIIQTKGKGKNHWCAGVLRQGGKLIYYFPVESGHVSYWFEYEITNEYLNVLQTDEERFYFLFALMHHTHQLQPHPTKKMRNEIFNTILLADKTTVSKYLTKNDGRRYAHGGISSLVGKFMDWKSNLPQPDNWFRI